MMELAAERLSPLALFSWLMLGSFPACSQSTFDVFDRMEGIWIGEGATNGQPVRDSIWFSRVGFSEDFLRFRLEEIGGNLKMDGYLWKQDDINYEFHEFNNGKWPVRHFRGTMQDGKLTLVERAADREILLVFFFSDDGGMGFQEYWLVKDGERLSQPELFVSETMTRVE